MEVYISYAEHQVPRMQKTTDSDPEKALYEPMTDHFRFVAVRSRT